MLRAFTKICSPVLFEPETTNALPLFATNSAATLVNAFLAASFTFGALTCAPPVAAATALYNAAIAAPCSEGFTKIRLSAFEPVIDIRLST